MYGSHDMRHTGFRRLTVVIGTPGFWGVTKNRALKEMMNSLLVSGSAPNNLWGKAKVILSVKIIRMGDSIMLSQEHYVEKILKRFGHFDAKHVSTPYDANTHLMKNRGDPVGQAEYAQIIGSLMHLMNFSRPDIAYAVCRLSRYTHNPNNDHWSALARLMKYLRGTMNYGILYSGFPVVLEGYSDANWISDSDEIKSTSGYVFTLGGGVVTWKSSKQTLIASSTMESEFIALESASKEAE